MPAIAPTPDIILPPPPLSDGLSDHAPYNLQTPSTEDMGVSGLFFFKPAGQEFTNQFLWKLGRELFEAAKTNLTLQRALSLSDEHLHRNPPPKVKLSRLPSGYQTWSHLFTPRTGVNQKIAIDAANQVQSRKRTRRVQGEPTPQAAASDEEDVVLEGTSLKNPHCTFQGVRYNLRRDDYVYGHPRSSRFRSPQEFVKHLVFLYTDPTLTYTNCACDYCDGYVQMLAKHLPPLEPTSPPPHLLPGELAWLQVEQDPDEAKEFNVEPTEPMPWPVVIKKLLVPETDPVPDAPLASGQPATTCLIRILGQSGDDKKPILVPMDLLSRFRDHTASEADVDERYLEDWRAAMRHAETRAASYVPMVQYDYKHNLAKRGPRLTEQQKDRLMAAERLPHYRAIMCGGEVLFQGGTWTLVRPDPDAPPREVEEGVVVEEMFLPSTSMGENGDGTIVLNGELVLVKKIPVGEGGVVKVVHIMNLLGKEEYTVDLDDIICRALPPRTLHTELARPRGSALTRYQPTARDEDLTEDKLESFGTKAERDMIDEYYKGFVAKNAPKDASKRGRKRKTVEGHDGAVAGGSSDPLISDNVADEVESVQAETVHHPSPPPAGVAAHPQQHPTHEADVMPPGLDEDVEMVDHLDVSTGSSGWHSLGGRGAREDEVMEGVPEESGAGRVDSGSDRAPTPECAMDKGERPSPAPSEPEPEPASSSSRPTKRSKTVDKGALRVRTAELEVKRKLAALQADYAKLDREKKVLTVELQRARQETGELDKVRGEKVALEKANARLVEANGNLVALFHGARKKLKDVEMGRSGWTSGVRGGGAGAASHESRQWSVDVPGRRKVPEALKEVVQWEPVAMQVPVSPDVVEQVLEKLYLNHAVVPVSDLTSLADVARQVWVNSLRNKQIREFLKADTPTTFAERIRNLRFSHGSGKALSEKETRIVTIFQNLNDAQIRDMERQLGGPSGPSERRQAQKDVDESLARLLKSLVPLLEEHLGREQV
ncbi:hypothetical protein M427DRAFT_145406 [Gonapodya prolifera JEL478]|uniref:Cryptic loci regulator 2 N-terminal domain-containing protein n=1 Tax=Gonapodya prolifera (strain JEL478) TaxID=1344416 RepID=A0A139AH03_GONPJ|nr:hypothetical protein M427DRAFT_145406 [Gonapodya prolifera JEL478]|eukprot:KXS15693.1 hypothetical protein M427DRAFT_145406 [Gonapodya prolifera JEL478]